MKNIFNVIIFDYNEQKFITHDVLEYFERVYYKLPKSKRPNNNELKEFIIKESKCEFWSRCEWEIMLQDWPTGKIEKKIDVYEQIMNNIDVVIKLFKENIDD